MTELASIEEALAFIETHLQAPITVADIADAAGYSLYYFCRVFNTVTHHTPYNYLIRRRLAEAARALVRTESRIIDIAYDYQFNNPETFTRACRRVFDATPSRLRERGLLDPHRLMPPLTPAHLAYLADDQTCLGPLLVQRPSLHLAGLMTWSSDEATPCYELWTRLERTLGHHEALSTRRDRYALRCYPSDWARHGFSILAAVALPEATVDLSGTPLVRKTVPAGVYVGFQHVGPPESLHLLRDYVYHTWLPQADRTLLAPFVLEHQEVNGVRTLFFPLSPKP